jgi:hypothetical protein
MDQGIAATLDPAFQPQAVLAPYARLLIARELAPAALIRKIGRAGTDAAELSLELPERLLRLLRAAEAGQFTVHLHADDLETLGRSAARVGNRIVVALLASSLIEATATLATRGHGRKRRREPTLLRRRGRRH